MHPLPEIPELPGRPASIGARVAAGIFDAFMLALITGALYYAPLRMGAFALPLLGALAAIVGYVIVPCAFFRSTLGMRLMGIEIIGMDGRRADLGELLSRELLGRAFIGFAYYSTWIVGIVGAISGSLIFFQPRGVGLVLFFLSGAMILLSLCGQAIIFTRRDRRGLPDLMAKTIVVKRGTSKAEDADLDEEEKRAFEKARARRARNVLVFDALLLAGTLLLPYLMSRPDTSAADFAARVKLASAEQSFNANPTNPDAADELTYLLEATGHQERITEIRAKHDEAVRAMQAGKEEALKAALAKDPKNWDTVDSLLELYDEQGRTDEAKSTFRAYVNAVPTADNRIGFGVWLYEHQKFGEAIPELEAAVKEGADSAEPHAYLGWAYLEQKRFEDARAELEKALEIDPDLEDVERDLAMTVDKLEGKPDDKPEGTPGEAPREKDEPTPQAPE